MYDRGLSVLEQYGLEAGAVYRGRGALICETQEGLVLIREYWGTPRKLEYQAKLLETISGASPIGTDQILNNKEGSYISGDSENVPYIVKKWYEGKECDTRSEKEICKGVSALASLHKVMCMPVQSHYVKESLCSEFQRHNRELRKIRKFILEKRRKNPFEQELLDTLSSFLGHERKPCTGWRLPDTKDCGSGNWKEALSAMENLTSTISFFLRKKSGL